MLEESYLLQLIIADEIISYRDNDLSIEDNIEKQKYIITVNARKDSR